MLSEMQSNGILEDKKLPFLESTLFFSFSERVDQKHIENPGNEVEVKQKWAFTND